MRIKRHQSYLLIVICLGLLLSACQILSPIQAANTNTIAPAPTTSRPTVTSMPSPTPTATAAPLRLFLSNSLPAELLATIPAPLGMVLTDNAEESDVVVEIGEKDQDYDFVSYQVFVLVAPFFTIADDIALKDLRNFLSGGGDLENAPFKAITSVESLIIRSLIDPKNPHRINFSRKQSEEDWLIVPFEQLQPGYKVISIDGISPLDEDFNPSNYALSLPVIARTTRPELVLEPDVLTSLLPQSNYQPDQLTSLIMTGVTAMARSTGFMMSTEGALYPGTYIREVMREADLTHISNEVSFYEDCPFPDPKYDGFIFCSDPEYLDLLIDLGTDIVELTGNHNNDVRAVYKVDTVPYTLNLYRQNDMQWYAGGTNLANAMAPLKIEHNGNKLAFVGCNSYGPVMAWATEDSSGSAPCQDWEWIKQTIAELKLEGYLPIVTLQYQEEYLQTATDVAIRDFRPLAEAGAVIVNGSQSHVSKPLEFYSDALIHYGLGNLFFDQVDFYITYDGFIQKHFFYQGRHISTQLLTITLEDTALPRFMTPEERAVFLQIIFSASEELRSTP